MTDRSQYVVVDPDGLWPGQMNFSLSSSGMWLRRRSATLMRLHIAHRGKVHVAFLSRVTESARVQDGIIDGGKLVDWSRVAKFVPGGWPEEDSIDGVPR